MANEENFHLALQDITRALNEFLYAARNLPPGYCPTCGFDSATLRSITDKARDYNVVVNRHNLSIDRANPSQSQLGF